jgi:hypothetical protein
MDTFQIIASFTQFFIVVSVLIIAYSGLLISLGKNSFGGNLLLSSLGVLIVSLVATESIDTTEIVTFSENPGYTTWVENFLNNSLPVILLFMSISCISIGVKVYHVLQEKKYTPTKTTKRVVDLLFSNVSKEIKTNTEKILDTSFLPVIGLCITLFSYWMVSSVVTFVITLLG